MKKLGFWLLLQLFVGAGLAQPLLKGTVTDPGNTPLAGASVVIKNSYQGVSTASDGTFEFKHLKPGRYLLAVSFIGFEPAEQEVDLPHSESVKIVLKPKSVFTDEVMVSATRAGDKTPVAFTNITGEDLKRRNMGQDIPYLLALSPSFVATSDAGAGIGYTNFRIRGTDLNRINVTVNGIPLNDAESHGTFFVDQPDLASSTDNIQVQRGVGTSTNGAAAFGATINLQTLTLNPEAYAELRTTAGSFNTFRNTVAAGTGLINGQFAVDVRLSKVTSDGYIDRASSDLKSFFVSAGWYGENSVLKFNLFSGLEETYQAWNGVPSVRLHNDLEGMKRYEEHWFYTPEETARMMAANSRTYNLYTYENQVDHYQQDHFQLHFSHRFTPALNLNAALHYTPGKGYYEQYKEDQDFADYGLTYPVVEDKKIESTDLIRRKWLDNHFYGAIFSLNYNGSKTDLSLGGGWSTYDGDHFGKIIWGRYLGETAYNHEWYRGNGLKKDFNIYGKISHSLSEKVTLFTDLQYRDIDYSIDGTDDDLRNLTQQHRFHFFNPKAGIHFRPAPNSEAWLSFARASREPNRDNFVDADPAKPAPKPEALNDFEAGFQLRQSAFAAGLNLYYMHYRDQLALTGQINDVGAPIMVNVDQSYRAGIELNWGIRLLRSLRWEANSTFSSNKINNFTEYVDDWDKGGQQAFELGTTDLSFSPKMITNSQLQWQPARNLSLNLISSYVGKQYIDNTANEDRQLDAYFVNSLKAEYHIAAKFFESITLQLLVNNLFDTRYESNAWVYSYLYDGQRWKMDGYFPQAGRNFMLGLDFKF